MLAPGAPAAQPVQPFVITDGARIEHSLSGAPGDPRQGAAVWDRAGCAACHGPDGPAPELTGSGSPMEAAVLRLWIVAPQAIEPETAKPGYYLPGQRLDPDDPLYGGPRLTAQEIEDLIAWLTSR